VAKPTRKTRQEQKLPKKKSTPSASSLEVARRAGSFADRADADEPISTRSERAAPARDSDVDAPKPKRSGAGVKPKKATSRMGDEEAAEAIPALDPAAASKGRAARLVGFAVAAIAIVVGVTWYADRKPEIKTAPSAAPAGKPGDEVTIFGDKPPQGNLPAPLKPAPSNAPPAPKPPEPAATPEPAPSAPAPAASPSAAAKKPAPPAPKPDTPAPKPDKPAPASPPKPPPAAPPPAAPKPPTPAADPYE
jgi:hypothetical protein